MGSKHKTLFSNYSFENWMNLILAGIVFFHIINIIAYTRHGGVGDDFVAYWSVGIVSDQKGYSQIYEIDNISAVYSNEIKEQGYVIDIDNNIYTAAYLPVFVLPFQLLSRVNIPYSYWIWNFTNLVILFGYLVYFLKSIKSRNQASFNLLYLLILVSISYPVIKNLTSGNVNVFLLICTGEFLRNAINKKTFVSGLWLGGLLLKPPLLILIVPILLITRNWDVLKGFFVSFGMILLASVFMVGFSGMISLINQWIMISNDTFSNTAPGLMINWRMIGFTLGDQFSMPYSWVITWLGILITILAVYFLTKLNPIFGSPAWVVVMLGVFSATIAITWHSHYYMAMVLIPFLLYALVYKLISQKTILLWVIVTPITMFLMDFIGLLDYFILIIGIYEFKWMVVTFSGFLMNLVILYSTIKYTKDNSLRQYSDPIC